MNLSNSLATVTTSIIGDKNSVFNLNNLQLNLMKEYQFKLPKLETPNRSPSTILNLSKSINTNNNKLKIRKINFNNSSKLVSHSLSRNKIFSPFFNSMHSNGKAFNNKKLHKIGNKSKMYKLLKLSIDKSKDDIEKKESENMTTESEKDDISDLKKEIEKNSTNKLSINKSEEAKEKDENNKNINKIENETEKNMEEYKDVDKEEKNNPNRKQKFDAYSNKNERKFKIEKLKIVNKENPKNIKGQKRKSFMNLMIPEINFDKKIDNQEKENKSCDAIKEDPNEERYKKVENLFSLVKEKTYNDLTRENKKDIESYLCSRGKNVEKMMSTKGTYYSFYNLLRNSKERNIILEEYMIRNRFNIKEPFSTKQKNILDRNNGFVKEIIKQESKFNEIIYKDMK